jgi:formate hydrogenlyase subunit 4
MIHEVMVLDHGGPDFALIQGAAALKMWAFCSLVVGMMLPSSGYAVVDALGSLAGLFGLAVIVGIVESTMARLRLVRVPQLLIGAAALSALALVLVYGEAVE